MDDLDNMVRLLTALVLLAKALVELKKARGGSPRNKKDEDR